MNAACKNCGKPVDVMIFRNEDYCSELCRKALITVQAATVNGGSKRGTKRR